MAQAKFKDYKTAFRFLREIAVGMIQRNPDDDGFYWTSEGEQMGSDQLKLLDAYSDSDSGWLDVDTGLMWKFNGCSGGATAQNAIYFGGYNDWRVPTLQELKTLSGSTKDEFGMFVKPSLAGRLNGKYRSSTPYFRKHADDDVALWDYGANDAIMQRYHEGGIKWGSEGSFAGFEKSYNHYSASTILVRGNRTDNISEWAQSLIDWAEGHELRDFPATENNILTLECLSIPNGSWPKYISMLKNIRCLHFQGGDEPPDELFTLTKLEELRLGRSISVPKAQENREVAFTLSEKIGNMTALTSLIVENIGLRELPASIGELRNLIRLKISRTQLGALPDNFDQLEQLEGLFLDFNELTALPQSIAHLKNIRFINIRCNPIKRLPDGFGNLSTLETLEMDGTALSVLPEEFSKLKNLEKISMERCKFEYFPDCIAEMQQLKSVNISFNPITSLPDNVGKMHSLKYLSLVGTRLVALPEALKSLHNLENINISATQLDAIPAWFGEMAKLTNITAAKMPNVKVYPIFSEKRIGRYMGGLD